MDGRLSGIIDEKVTVLDTKHCELNRTTEAAQADHWSWGFGNRLVGGAFR